MSTVALYVKPAGTVVNLKTKANAQVITYMVFVRQWNNGSSSLVTTWFPAGLESAAGETLTLVQCDGYDLILKAQIKGSPDTAAIDPRLSIDGAVAYKDTLHLPAAEGVVVVREWSFIIG